MILPAWYRAAELAFNVCGLLGGGLAAAGFLVSFVACRLSEEGVGGGKMGLVLLGRSLFTWGVGVCLVGCGVPMLAILWSMPY